MRKILLGSLALMLSAGLVACDDNANGEAEGNSALPKQALPAADVLKPVDPSIPEIDLSQPAPIIAGPGADTGQAGMGETGTDEAGMDETGMPGEGMMPGEEGGPDRLGGPAGAPAESVSPIGAGEEPGVGGDEAPAEEDIGTEETE